MDQNKSKAIILTKAIISAKAIISTKAPQNKKELQKFLGQVNYLRRFISNMAGKTKVFSDLVKLKEVEDFK